MLDRRTASNGIVYYESPLLRACGVPHAFSTRIGGTSPPPFDSLNLGNPSGCDVQDDYPRIYENYASLQETVGLGGRTRCWVHQVHGGEVALIERDRPFESGIKADAMVSNDPTRILSVRTADCVPVLMSTADGRCVGAIHAGWRGVVAGVVPKALQSLTARNALAPSAGTPGRSCDEGLDLFAAIGPCIGLEHFEVGPEVLDQFERVFDVRAPLRRRDDGKGHVDLREAVRLQLLAAGVGEDRIDTTDRCSFRDREEFFSHRRDNGMTGRMAALISPRP